MAEGHSPFAAPGPASSADVSAPVPLSRRRSTSRQPVPARRIAIVGSGVVGTATGVGLEAKGHDVVFCDISRNRLAVLRKRGLSAIAADALLEEDRDVYLISVPSPTVEGEVDTSYVAAAASLVGRAIAKREKWSLVVVRSTVPPGTTEGVVRPIVEREAGRAAGDGFGLCMNPEFLRELSAEQDFMDPRVIVIGALDERSDAALRRLYAGWPDVPVVSMSLRDAELTKYTSNLFNAAKISFFNEMEQICQAFDADARNVFGAVVHGAEGLWNPAYGTRGLFPYGGACLPKDTVGFLGFARERGLGDQMLLLQATIETNERLAVTQANVELPAWREQERAQAS
jgi:UDPglucose 6-dehydrogenase